MGMLATLIIVSSAIIIGVVIVTKSKVDKEKDLEQFNNSVKQNEENNINK